MPSSKSPSPLLKVEREAAKAASARAGFHLAIREAHTAGEPLRAIATAAGLSHEQVRRIVRFE